MPNFEIKILSAFQSAGLEQARAELAATRASAAMTAPELDKISDPLRKIAGSAEHAENGMRKYTEGVKLAKDAEEAATGSIRGIAGLLKGIHENSTQASISLKDVATSVGGVTAAGVAFTAGFKIGEELGVAAIAIREFASGMHEIEKAEQAALAVCALHERQFAALERQISKANDQLKTHVEQLKAAREAEAALDAARSGREKAALKAKEAAIESGPGSRGEKDAAKANLEIEQAGIDFRTDTSKLEGDKKSLSESHVQKQKELDGLLTEQVKLQNEKNDAERAYKALLQKQVESGKISSEEFSVLSAMGKGLKNILAQYTGKFEKADLDNIDAQRVQYQQSSTALEKFGEEKGKSISDLQAAIAKFPIDMAAVDEKLAALPIEFRTKLQQGSEKISQAGVQIRKDIEDAAKELAASTKYLQAAKEAAQTGGQHESAQFEYAQSRQAAAQKQFDSLSGTYKQIMPGMTDSAKSEIQKFEDSLEEKAEDAWQKQIEAQNKAAERAADAEARAAEKQESADERAAKQIERAIQQMADRAEKALEKASVKHDAAVESYSKKIEDSFKRHGDGIAGLHQGIGQLFTKNYETNLKATTALAQSARNTQ